MKFFQIKLIFLLISLFTHFSLQYSIILRDNNECFYEDLEKEDQIVITYQAGSENGAEDSLYINFIIFNPEEKPIINIQHSNFHEYSLNADSSGKYKFCFSNEVLSGPEIELFFNVHRIKYKHNTKNVIDFNTEVTLLSEILRDVKDEQEYIKAREKAHRNVAESTNSRVQNWNLFQIIVLVGLIFFQIYFLKRFFEIKRII
ncbi:hypothetical protein PCANB_000648 [Pneumocystis canis]|nr:hypothetical protein PCANB_000648 [Pneumocystis canis]